MNRDDSQERFIKDVRDHKLTIVKDDGVHRHLRLARAGSSAYWYDIITWPGHLAIAGDMGANVFARTPDMFKFFRNDSEDPEKLGINPGYWKEKIQNDSTHTSEFSYEYFEKRVRDALEERKDEFEDYEDLVESAEEEIFDSDLSEERLRERLAEFEWEGETVFIDTWEWRFTEHTFGYLWQCYAIVWAIKQYDAHKEKEATK